MTAIFVCVCLFIDRDVHSYTIMPKMVQSEGVVIHHGILSYSSPLKFQVPHKQNIF